MLIVGFPISRKNVRNSASHTFSKNKYMSASGISPSSTFVKETGALK